MIPGNTFIMGSKGQRLRSWNTQTLLALVFHSCECWLLLVSFCYFPRALSPTSFNRHSQNFSTYDMAVVLTGRHATPISPQCPLKNIRNKGGVNFHPFAVFPVTSMLACWHIECFWCSAFLTATILMKFRCVTTIWCARYSWVTKILWFSIDISFYYPAVRS